MSSLTEALKKIYQIGPAKAKELIAEFINLELITKEQSKATNFTDKHVRKLLKNPKIYPTLSDATRVDLDEEPMREIPRSLIDKLNKELIRIWDEVAAEGNSVPKWEIAGSYIRGKPASGDIDFVLSTPLAQSANKWSTDQTWDYFIEIVNARSKILRIQTPFSRGSSKVDTLFEFPKSSANSKFKVDIFLTTPDEYIFAKLFAIGNGLFNIRMRAVAKRKGYLLNQRGLFKIGPPSIPVLCKKEEDIFEKLGMRYREPKDRNS